MPSRCRSRKSFLSENLCTCKRKIITWPVTGVDLQTLYVDVLWLDTGIESLNSSDVPWQDTGIESANSSDVPWLDTGIEFGNVVKRYALAGYRNRIWICCS